MSRTSSFPDWQKAVAPLLSARRFTLPNGLTSLVLPAGRSRSAAVYLAVKTGSAHEGRWMGAGLSHLVEHMFFKGTRRRTKEQLEAAVRRFGGYMNAYTSHDLTVFYLTVLSESLYPALEFMAEAAFEPAHSEEEFSKERQVILSEIQMDEDQIGRKSYEELCAALFRIHPYRHPVIGYKPLFEALTVADLRDFYSEHYVPNHMVLSVAGNLDPDQTEEWIETLFGKAPIGRPPAQLITTEPPQSAPRFRLLRRPAEHPRALIGYPTVSLAHQESVAFDLLAEALGGSRSSRLNQRLHEDRKLALETSSFHHSMAEAGIFCAELVCRGEDLAAARDGLVAEVESAANEGWTEAEIQRAKNRILADHFEHLESHSELAHALIQSETLAGDIGYWENYLRSLHELSPEKIQTLAGEYLRPDRRTEVRLIPSDKVPRVKPAAVNPILPAENESAFALIQNPGLPRLIHRYEKDAPLVHLIFAAKGGVLYEPGGAQGLSSMLADLLIKGAGPYSQKEIAERVNSWGGGIEPFSGLNTFGFAISFLRNHIKEAFGLVGKILTDSTLDPGEIQKVRHNHLEALAAESEDIYSYASRRLMEALFGDHPYARNPVGNPESLSRIGRDDLRKFLDQRIQSGDWFIGFTGDVRRDDIAGIWSEAVGGITIPQADPTLQTKNPVLKWTPQAPSGQITRRTLPKEQAVVLRAYSAPDINDNERYAALVLQTILNGSGGRLYKSIRDDKSMAYVVGCSLSLGLAAGHMTWYAGCDPDRAEEARNAMDEEADRLLRDGITAEEIDEARIYLLGQWEQSRESSEARLRESVFAVLLGNGLEATAKYPEAIRSVRAEEIHQLIQRRFSGGPLTQVIVSPHAAESAH